MQTDKRRRRRRKKKKKLKGSVKRQKREVKYGYNFKRDASG